MTTALLLIAHGSREAEANADLVFIADEVRKRGEFTIVEPAFLELAEPTIRQACERCVASGAGRVILVPYFLSAGIHVRRDLEGHKKNLAGVFPKTEFVLASPLGRSPLLVDLVIQRAQMSG